MDNRYSADTITIGDDEPAVVDHLNDILESAGQGRPLGAPTGTYGSRAVVPVAGADPLVVCQILRAAATALDPRPELTFYSGTNQGLEVPPPIDGQVEEIGEDVGHLAGPAAAAIGKPIGHLAGPGTPSIGKPIGHIVAPAIGKPVGHGLAYAQLPEDFLPAQPPPAWKPPAAGLRRPVVALLDSGVRTHPWLPSDLDDPFVTSSDDIGFRSPVPQADDGERKAGHATFIAGLIRFNAPSARVLSVRVMDGDGKVRESDVVAALLWLESYRAAGHPVDVILMPFGRPPGDEGDADALAALGASIERLAAAGVALVASAGNDHQDGPIHPAAFEDVISVGAGFGEYHADFSNYGDWVDRYRDGVNALSVFPGGGWARWSGTSFAAAVFAADLARPHVA